MSIDNTNFRKTQKGLAVVELALITPVLLVFIMMTAEFTRVFYQSNTLNKSVRDASRYLSINAKNAAGVVSTTEYEQKTRNLAAYGSINGGNPILPGLTAADFDIDDNVDLGNGTEPKPHITVSITYDFQPITPFLNGLNFLGQNKNMQFQLTASSTMVAM